MDAFEMRLELLRLAAQKSNTHEEALAIANCWRDFVEGKQLEKNVSGDAVPAHGR
jgi:hypothetical protein